MRLSRVREVKFPTRGTDKSAGIDFYIPENFDPTVVRSHEDVLIPSGIVADVPEGYMLMAANKSGIVTSRQAKVNAHMQAKGLTMNSSLVIGAAIIDEDYQGEIHIHLINTGIYDVTLMPGMKIAQFILVPVSYASLEEVPIEELFNAKSQRGDGGFGSTTAK